MSTSTASTTKKLIDYTQRGKRLNEEYRDKFKRCGSSLSTLSTEPSSICSDDTTIRPDPERVNGSRSNGGSLKSTLSLLMKATTKPQDSEEPIDFLLRIPSVADRRREQRSDLRERFTKTRSLKRCTTIKSTLTRSRKQAEQEASNAQER
jgi:hypothetical protein